MICSSILLSCLATKGGFYSISLTPKVFWMAGHEKLKTKTFSLGKAFSIFLFWDNKA
jgi:hypothetical protein